MARIAAAGDLLGRDEELRLLRSLIGAARNGASGARLVRGEAGMGKSALLRAAADGWQGVRVVRADGYETESSLPFAAVQRITLALVDHVAGLPPRQADALRVAGGHGRHDGPDPGVPPDRFLVGLALLALLARAAQDAPVVVVADDAHWLDHESLDTLVFVARRLRAESVVLLLGLRDDPELDARVVGIPSVRLDGLDARSAATLLAASSGRVLEPQAAARIVAATGGNPLALIDLAEDLSVSELIDLSWSDEPVPVRRRLEAHYWRLVRALPRPTQRWLLVAAASSTGRSDLVQSTARRLGGGPEDGRPAQDAGLVRVREHVGFRHPLVRAAVYSAASAAERREVHVALGETADEHGLPDVAAWHRGQAAFGADPLAARDLDAAAQRAGRRGAHATQAKLLARAAELTPPGAEHAERLLAAAEAASAAGAARAAHDLLDRMAGDDLDAVQQGRAIVVRAELAAYVADPAAVVRATAELVRAADLFRGREPQREQAALLRAYEMFQPTEWLLEGITLPELGHRFRAGALSAPGPAATALEALASLVLDPYPQAVPALRAALEAVEQLDDAGVLRFGYVSTTLTSALWDERARAACLVRAAAVARELGVLRLLDAFLWILALTEVERGDPASGSAYVNQTTELRQALGYDAELVVNAAELAWTGAPRGLVQAVADGLLATGFGGAHTVATTALAARDLAEGRYAEAYAALAGMVARRQIHITHHQLPDLVEAAARSGHPVEAERATVELEELARACASPWALGLARRSRALVSPPDRAEEHYRAAIEHLGVSGTPVDRGRAHLLLGEWLRRERRREDARAELRAALTVFERVHAPAFAARARTELEATGVRVAERAVDPGRAGLTPRELAVARMAAAGRTNAEIGATLFISANTVDYHLRKVFQKLGVTSRRRLGERLDGLGPTR